MKARLINGVSKKYSTTYDFNDGLNAYSEPTKIKDNQLADCSNISNAFVTSSVKTRPIKIHTQTLSTGYKGMGYARGNLHWIDGDKWYIGITNSYTLTNAIERGSFGEFSTGTTHYAIYSNSVDRIAWDGTNFTSITNAPNSKYFAAANGRLFWIYGNKLIFSALQDIFDYTPANGGGEITFEESKELRTIISYNNNIYVWDNINMYILYGTSPETFEKYKINSGIGHSGGVYDGSYRACVCNSVLYWLADDGVYKYSGGVPECISLPLLNFFKINIAGLLTTASMVATERRIFISLSIGTFEYDTVSNKWYKRSDIFEGFAFTGNNLHGIEKTTNKLYTIMDTGIGGGEKNPALEPSFPWYFTTKAFNFSSISKQNVISEIWVQYSLVDTSTMILQYKEDNGTFTTLYTFATTSGNTSTIRILIPANKLNNNKLVQFKFSGTGTATFNYMEIKHRIKPR